MKNKCSLFKKLQAPRVSITDKLVIQCIYPVYIQF